jgi:putative spermidine/putrescine transport system permease protein
MRSHRGPLGRITRTTGFGMVWCLRAGAFALLFVPILLVALLSFGAGSYATIPPAAYSMRWYWNIFERQEFVSSFITSVTVAAIVTPVSVLIGTLAAYGLWKKAPPSARLVQALLMSPVLLPLVVTGLALLVLFNRLNLQAGIFTLVVAHIVITFPYSFRSALAVLERYDRQLDEAAASLRVPPWKTFFHVTLPMIQPGIFAGALFAFVMSFDDFAATIFLIGPTNRTLPVAIYQYMEFNLDPTVSAVSTLLVLLAIGTVMLIERMLGLDRFVGLRN